MCVDNIVHFSDSLCVCACTVTVVVCSILYTIGSVFVSRDGWGEAQNEMPMNILANYYNNHVVIMVVLNHVTLEQRVESAQIPDACENCLDNARVETKFLQYLLVYVVILCMVSSDQYH